jgi:protein-S-isoprenylcysteine O-methyltransferase Ste14
VTPPLRPDVLLRWIWLAWLIAWWTAAVWSSRAVNRPGLGRQLLFRALVIAGAVLLFGVKMSDSSMGRVGWKPTLPAALPFIVLALAGLGFTWWARLHIGTLWSSGVTRKADHRVVDTGPYGIVRHPIYTGVITAALATAFVPFTPVTILGAGLIAAGFYVKARVEERFLREELGADAYDAYARRVPMLVPRL